MKKLIALLLVLAMVLSVTACGNQKNVSNTGTTGNDSTAGHSEQSANTHKVTLDNEALTEKLQKI